MQVQEIKEKVKSFLENIGFDLYDLEIVKERKETILRIYIDITEGVNMDDVVLATQELNPFIDELDPIEGEYMMEVSSPGAERELRTAEAIKHAINHLVYVETFTQNFEGDLIAFDGDTLTLSIKNKKVKVNYIDVNLIRLAIDFRRRK
ncbi:ribosome maturation factor RimP [Hujiaoplasma nucleasis]|uniref:Ribosome maturation factor RimP n=1 Tax=Hujiaoplasma nucleasis TaxID=2725268 RepID=A0A7L6N4Y0_9MOLU|nr:ribosome maturation factor RimP [Hujiaoplasma nucleasis]QLY40055.1 ribosome maturation factor RimP [Hujiaoplasma nucleasis]